MVGLAQYPWMPDFSEDIRINKMENELREAQSDENESNGFIPG